MIAAEVIFFFSFNFTQAYISIWDLKQKQMNSGCQFPLSITIMHFVTILFDT
uniref:Uncharacterized protein n=1 Tax=Arundo donax TaxID=35708 RepID=A0A0A9BS51_ARUDO